MAGRPQDSEAVTTLTFSPDGKTLANGSKSMRLRFWNLADGTCTNSIKVRTAACP